MRAIRGNLERVASITDAAAALSEALPVNPGTCGAL
jgi:hypothetical protein